MTPPIQAGSTAAATAKLKTVDALVGPSLESPTSLASTEKCQTSTAASLSIIASFSDWLHSRSGSASSTVEYLSLQSILLRSIEPDQDLPQGLAPAEGTYEEYIAYRRRIRESPLFDPAVLDEFESAWEKYLEERAKLELAVAQPSAQDRAV